MAILITDEIPQQNFEFIRDRIGAIIAEELNNQAVNLIGDTDLDATVFVERFVPFAGPDFPCINVMFSGGPYENQNTLNSTGIYSYLIDVYTAAKSTDGQGGDQKATFILQRIMGIVRSILENPVYRSLGFGPGVVASSNITDIGVMNPLKAQDATSAVKGRVILTVKACESTQLLDASPIDSFVTQAKINLTDKGYKYEIN